MEKGHCKLPELKTSNYLDYPLSTSIVYFMVEQLPRKQLYQVNVKSELWGTSDPLPKTFAQAEIQDPYVSLVL